MKRGGRRRVTRTEHLQPIALKSNRLVHVLQQSSRRRNEDVHLRQPIHLVLDVLAPDDETGREGVVGADLAKDFEDLDGLTRVRV